ncbi:MAG TPA: hypothetical protein VKA49_03500 [Flavitalea sp.]|nr:hypothetical protein [Flavitalea sp.]
MKAKFLIGALVLIIGFTSCGSSYYVTGHESPNRHRVDKKNYDENNNNPQGYFPRGDWRYRGGPSDWRYRRW